MSMFCSQRVCYCHRYKHIYNSLYHDERSLKLYVKVYIKGLKGLNEDIYLIVLKNLKNILLYVGSSRSIHLGVKE